MKKVKFIRKAGQQPNYPHIKRLQADTWMLLSNIKIKGNQ